MRQKDQVIRSPQRDGLVYGDAAVDRNDLAQHGPRNAEAATAPFELFREPIVDMMGVEVNAMGYTVILEQEPDGGYVVHVPAMPGCVSQGETRAEALANIREAIELYIEDCVEAGDPVPKEVGREFLEVEAGT